MSFQILSNRWRKKHADKIDTFKTTDIIFGFKNKILIMLIKHIRWSENEVLLLFCFKMKCLIYPVWTALTAIVHLFGIVSAYFLIQCMPKVFLCIYHFPKFLVGTLRVQFIICSILQQQVVKRTIPLMASKTNKQKNTWKNSSKKKTPTKQTNDVHKK